MSPYRTVLAERFGLLHPALRACVAGEGQAVYSGTAQVTRADGAFRNLAAWLLGLPPTGQWPVQLQVISRGDRQHWIRRFGEHVFQTRQRAGGGLLVESLGLGSLGFELATTGGNLVFHCRRAWLCGLPLPAWCAPDVLAVNEPNEDGWRFEVRMKLPLLGEVIHYDGAIVCDSAPAYRSSEK